MLLRIPEISALLAFPSPVKGFFLLSCFGTIILDLLKAKVLYLKDIIRMKA